MADFQRGTKFTTPPYTSLGNWLKKIAVVVRRQHSFWRTLAQRGPAAAHAPQVLLPAREPIDVTATIRQYNQARRYELANNDELAQAAYAGILRNPDVPDSIKWMARYWSARLAWRHGDRVVCQTSLALLNPSDMPEPWKSATARMWVRCGFALLKEQVVEKLGAGG